MSATSRGAERHERDFYETPPEAVHSIAHLLPRAGYVYDAGCGSGALVRHAGSVLSGAYVTGVDLVPQVEAGEHYDEVHAVDWLEFEEDQPSTTKMVITNPPYSKAREFIDHALDLVGPEGHVWALLRLGFLASQRRFHWWQQHPADVYVLSKRPSFTGNGRTDASAYMWAAWGPGPRGTWEVVW